MVKQRKVRYETVVVNEALLKDFQAEARYENEGLCKKTSIKPNISLDGETKESAL